MTSRERLTAVLERRIPDTVPICVRGVSPFGDKMNWMGRHHESYQRLRDFVRANGDILHGVGFDTGVFLSGARVEEESRVIREDEDWSDLEHSIGTPQGPIRSVTRRSRHNLYEVMEVEHFIKDEEDYRRFMSIPYIPVRPDVKGIVEAKDREVGESGILSVFMPEAIAYVHQLFGSEGLALWSVTQRERLMRLFETLGGRVLDYVGHLVREGAGPLFSCAGAELAVPPLMSPGDFHDFVTVIDRPVHELVHAHGGYIMMPAASPFEPVLSEQAFEGYREYVRTGREYGRY